MLEDGSSFSLSSLAGNVIPKTIVKLYDTAVAALESGDPALFKEAQKIQDIVSEADWIIVKVSLHHIKDPSFVADSLLVPQAGIGGTKYALDVYIQQGLGGNPRKPLPPADDAIKSMIDKDLKRASMSLSLPWPLNAIADLHSPIAVAYENSL